MSGAGTLWSRRRAAVAAEEQAEKAALEARALAEEQARLEEKTDEEILAELDLPDPESLSAGDDFSRFMAKAVPDRIRRRALRVLWRSNPVLANVDSLVDYGEDFTDGANVIENMQTAYQVGKGMLKHVEEMARQAEEKARIAEAAPLEETEDETPALAMADEAEAEAETATPGTESDIETEETSAEGVEFARPRRMKFRTEETA
ncbi:DUF3306 domain-containing protein [Roseovarius faecimaris]|uniref:DUF3306 domain-containing protein n=1 Tax=Roseovarius faecimaris TaxID=2494550 RepID=A0A6I6IL76_9RHOB|nr:DUF3306 domain-containing protein [Roseovarius faecimaris]QGX97042.1 DUF3306 domain-containing protein [Roseovarius faecimaris]